MKRLLAVALLLLAPAAARAQGTWCGHTGFDVTLGVTTKSFRCAPKKLVRGTGTLTLNGTSTVTVSPAAPGFSEIVTPDAIPGADATFFNTSGLYYRFSGLEYYLRISAKA